MTAEELLHRSKSEGRCELVRGELMPLPYEGMEHGVVSSNVMVAVTTWVRETGAGTAFAGGTGFLLERRPDTVLAPDYAFVPTARFRGNPCGEGYVQVPPALVVEIVGQSEQGRVLKGRIETWLRFGVDEVWLVEPEARELTVHARENEASAIQMGGVLRGAGALAGLSVAVSSLFSG